jgi:hypothetical protein
MLGLVGFLMGALTVWISYKMLGWSKEGEKQIEDIKNDRKLE